MTQPIDYTPFFFEHEGMEIRRVDLEAGMRYKVDPTVEYGFELKESKPTAPGCLVFFAERQLPEGQGSLTLHNFDLVRGVARGEEELQHHRVMLGSSTHIIRRDAQGKFVAMCRVEDIPLDPENVRFEGDTLSCLEAELLIGFRWGAGNVMHSTSKTQAIARFLREGLIETTNEACFDYQLTDKGEKVVFAMLRAGSEAIKQ